MNIFYLDTVPKNCAVYHNDKHVVKMIVETAQILSTNFRLVEGSKKEVLLNRKKSIFSGFYDRETGDPIMEMVDNWKPYQKYIIDSDIIDDENKLQDRVLYLETHANHPSTIWARENRKL